MLKILACTHGSNGRLGFFEEILPSLGVDYEYQELYLQPQPRSLIEYQGLIIMGGSMNVDQVREYPFLRTDYQYIETALKAGLPVLGFCLGAQLLAKTLGRRVYKNTKPELGWYDLEPARPADSKILNGFPAQCKVFEWHRDTFDLPGGAQLLASTDGCKNQAFAWREKAFGFQFHMEINAAMIDEWLADTRTVRNWGFDPDQIKTATAHNIQSASNLCMLLGQNFVKLLSASQHI
jgi:GMP synthase (glutamine-hydrolysing)